MLPVFFSRYLCVTLTLFLGCVSCDYTLLWLNSTSYGWTGSLALSSPGPYSGDFSVLNLDVYFETVSRLRVKIAPPSQYNRWQVPREVLSSTPPSTFVPLNSALYNFAYTNSPFTFSITRVSTGQVLFNSNNTLTGSSLIFQQQFMQISTQLPSNAYIYGLGERITNFRLPLGSYYMFASDQGNPPTVGLYGSHPVYYRLEGDGNAHAVLLFNSNPLDVSLSASSLTYQVVGGVFDFYFFLGPNFNDVQSQYTELIGRPFLPPLWSLGFHQCRWGYPDTNTTKNVVLSYQQNNLPLDTIWNDIDYMDYYYSFTYSSTRFAPSDQRSFNSWLHQRGQRRVLILDPALPIANTTFLGDRSYSSFMNGLSAGGGSSVYIRSPTNDSVLINRVWPHVNVAYPDFTNPNTQQWWTSEIQNFFNLGGNIDGLWNDMNEPAAFCNGQFPNGCQNVVGPSYSDPAANIAGPTTWVPNLANNGQFPNVIPEPPFSVTGNPLASRTVNLSAVSYISQQYDLHNLYGFYESRASTLALKSITGQRAFVLSRSTFVGSGAHVAHWTGDNGSTFNDLKTSIASILAMNLFGIPFTGSDICGFYGTTSVELCSRWMQLGSLYPFSRNHNYYGSPAQEPYALGPDVLAASLYALNQRYSLLSYFYTLFAISNKIGLGVWRPVFSVYPLDSNTYTLNTAFLVGASLYATPVTDSGSIGVEAYFPNDDFFVFSTGVLVQAYNPAATSGVWLPIVSPVHSPLPLFQIGGSIIPLLQPGLTTSSTFLQYTSLKIALSSRTAPHSASGWNYADDGISLNPNTFVNVSYSASISCDGSKGFVASTVYTSSSSILALSNFSSFTFYGVPIQPSLSQVVFSFTSPLLSTTLPSSSFTFSYNSSVQTLVVGWSLSSSLNLFDPHGQWNLSWSMSPSSSPSSSAACAAAVPVAPSNIPSITPPPPPTVTLYFQEPLSWSLLPNVYTWGGPNFGGWPGTGLVLDSSSDSGNWYRSPGVVLDSAVTQFNVLFNIANPAGGWIQTGSAGLQCIPAPAIGGTRSNQACYFWQCSATGCLQSSSIDPRLAPSPTPTSSVPSAPASSAPATSASTSPSASSAPASSTATSTTPSPASSSAPPSSAPPSSVSPTIKSSSSKQASSNIVLTFFTLIIAKLIMY